MRRALSIAVLATAVVAALACAGGDEEAPKMAPGTPPDPAGSSAKPQEPTGPCADDCMLLLEHDVQDLQKGGFCETCPSDGCDGWPREKLSCDQVDFLRNCMYARLGYTFSKAEEWREVFDKEDWYQPREDFSWDEVSRVQVRNANWLKDRRSKRDCVR